MSDFPRRNRIDLLTPEELAIYNLIQEIEKLGADVRLTNTINHLSNAKNSLADFVDGEPVKPKKHIQEKIDELITKLKDVNDDLEICKDVTLAQFNIDLLLSAQNNIDGAIINLEETDY